MHDRSALGPADVSDEVLEQLVADLLDVPGARLVSSRAEPVDYDIPAITTASRHWLRGTATVAGRERPWSLFVKQVQSWSRSPLFAGVPPEIRETAAAGVPWRTEPAVYRSDLADRLPDGLTMTRALRVDDLDDLSTALWLEPVPVQPVVWDLPRYRQAAGLLGRFAARPRVQALAGIGGHSWTVTTYFEGRVLGQLVPMLRTDELWTHPLVANEFAELREPLLAAADRAGELTAELLAMPHLAGHGDASPNNLLVVADHDGFTLIDFGFFGRLPVGFDLGQLLVGEVQLGHRRPDDLAERDAACLDAYVAGLRAEGTDIDVSVVRRAHALQLMLFTGLSCLPFEHLGAEPTSGLRSLVAARAAIGRHAVDLLDATA